MTVPLRLDEKKRLFDCFYHTAKGREELFAHIEYFGWDLNENKEDIFWLLKQPTENPLIPDCRRFMLSAEQRGEIASGYAKFMEHEQGCYDPNFFNYLPLHDIDNRLLYPLLKKFTKHPELGKHLHEYPLNKEQKVALLKECSLHSHRVLEHLAQFKLDPIQDVPVILTVFINACNSPMYAGESLINPAILPPIFSYFAFSPDEKATILKILADDIGPPLLDHLEQLGFNTIDQKNKVFEIAILCFSKMKSPLGLEAVITIFKKIDLLPVQNFLLLKIVIRTQRIPGIENSFTQLLRKISFGGEQNPQRIFILFEQAIKSPFINNKLLILKQSGQYSFTREQTWSLAQFCVWYYEDIRVLDTLGYIKELKMDNAEDQPHYYQLFAILASRWPDKILEKKDFSLTSDQKKYIFTICSKNNAKTLLNDGNLKFWLGKEDALDKEFAYEFIKMNVVSLPRTIEFLATFSFSVDERMDILVQCHKDRMGRQLADTDHLECVLTEIHHFTLTEPERIKVFNSIFNHIDCTKTYEKDLFDWILRFPIPPPDKIPVLLSLSEFNFIRCLKCLDKLGLDECLMRKTLYDLFSNINHNTNVFYNIKNIQFILSIHKKYNCDKKFSILYLHYLLKNETIWVIEQLGELGLDLHADREEIFHALKQSKCPIKNLPIVLQIFPLTKNQQADLLLQQAGNSYFNSSEDSKHFLNALKSSALTAAEDRETILQILYKWIATIQSGDFSSLIQLLSLSKDERKMMARLHVQSRGCPALSYLQKFGLDWTEDREFILELVYETARGNILRFSRFLIHLQSLPLLPSERQRVALIRYSSQMEELPIKVLHLLEWDLVKDRKKILQSWKQMARQNSAKVIEQIQYFTFEKAEKITLAKLCAQSSQAHNLLSKLPLFGLHSAEDQSTLFEITILLCMNVQHDATPDQLIQTLDLQLDKKKNSLLHLIYLIRRGIKNEGSLPNENGILTAILTKLKTKQEECKGQDWFSIVEELVNKTSSLLQAFEPFFTEYLLEPFYTSTVAARAQSQAVEIANLPEPKRQKIMREFASEILQILLHAIDTPNRQVKADVLPLLFVPMLCALKNEDSVYLGQVIKNFNVCVKNAPAQTAMARLYLFGIFPAQKEIKSISMRIDKLFRGLDKTAKIDLNRAILGFFQLLYTNKKFSDKQKWKLLQTVFSTEFLGQISRTDKQNLTQSANNLQKQILFARLILQCAFFSDYLQQKARPPLPEYVENKVLDLLPKGCIPQEIKLLQQFWINSNEKIAEAFFSYCGSLATLTPGDQSRLLPLWKGYLLSAAQGLENYQSWKNEISAVSAHWNILSKYPQIVSYWKNRVCSEKTLAAFSTHKPDYKHIFLQKIVHDSHLNGVDHLYAYLKESMDIVPALPADENSPRLQFQSKAMEFLCFYARDEFRTPQECKRHLEALKHLLMKFAPQAEFINDLQGLITSLERDRRSNRVSLLVTDDPLYLFRMVYEVSGSCQRQDGHAYNNKCLLGYLCNPYIKAVVLEDKQQVMQARAVLKLLVYEKGEGEEKKVEPIAFLERPYPPNISQEEVELLWEAAKKFADSMQVPLAATDDLYTNIKIEQKHKDCATVSCAGGIAPYEYSDAAKGGQSGKYTISDACYWTPENIL